MIDFNKSMKSNLRLRRFGRAVDPRSAPLRMCCCVSAERDVGTLWLREQAVVPNLDLHLMWPWDASVEHGCTCDVVRCNLRASRHDVECPEGTYSWVLYNTICPIWAEVAIKDSFTIEDIDDRKELARGERVLNDARRRLSAFNKFSLRNKSSTQAACKQRSMQV